LTGAQASWRADVRALGSIPIAPPGWRRLALRVLAAYAGVIVICLIGGPLLYGSRDKMFGERQLCTYATVAALGVSGALCFQIYGLLKGRRLALFWLMFGILMCMTGLDDLVRIHERIDLAIHKFLHLDPKNKVTDHIDDFIVLGYSLPAMGLAIWHAPKLIQATLGTQLVLGAMASFLVHVLFDIFHFPGWAEESVKLLSAALLMLAFFAIRMDAKLLERWLGAGFPLDASVPTERPTPPPHPNVGPPGE
jgi:hypothetical protein